jgi:hypothetical protein
LNAIETNRLKRDCSSFNVLTLDRQLAVLFDVSEVVGQLAALAKPGLDTTLADWTSTERKWWAIYYGNLRLSAQCSVMGSAGDFASRLEKFKASPNVENVNKLRARAEEVNASIGGFVRDSWIDGISVDTIFAEGCGGMDGDTDDPEYQDK